MSPLPSPEVGLATDDRLVTAEEHRLDRGYQGYVRHKRLVIVVEAALLLAVALVALGVGSSGMSLEETVLALIGRGTTKATNIVWNLRMPRILTAILGGIALAMAGCVYQSVLRNPLASASTLGVAQGASFGASVAIIVFGAGVIGSNAADAVSVSDPYLVFIMAFLGSMISALVILGFSRFRRMTPSSMILCGVALSALFSGASALIQYFADDMQVAAVVFWTFGDLGRTTYGEVSIIAATTLATGIFFLFNRWNYNAMESGEESAMGLGVNANAVRLSGVVFATLASSVVVSFVGIVNFIGLIAPHIMRRFVGSDYRFLLPASAFMGAIILLAGDLLARMAIAPVVLPIGAITSFLGAPLFLYLIFKGVGRG